MKIPSPILVSTILLLLCSPLQAAYLEYTTGSKTYTVDGLKGTNPYIGTDPESRTLLRSGGQWTFTLEPGDSLKSSIPAYNYQESILAKKKGDPVTPYLRIHEPRYAEKRIKAWSSDQMMDASLVYAWIYEDKILAVTAVPARSKHTAALELNPEYKSGSLRIFAFKNGKILPPSFSDFDRLALASIEGDLKTLKKARITRKTRSADNETLLHFAAMAGNTDSIRYLIEEAKLKIDAETKKDENSPLTLAVDRGRTRAVQALLELGANPNQKNRYQESPIVFAARNGATEIFKLIAEAGGDFVDKQAEFQTNITGLSHPIHLRTDNIANGTYSSALLIAADKGYAQIVSYILNSDTKTKRLTPNPNVARYIVDQMAFRNEVPTAIKALKLLSPKIGSIDNGRTLLHSFAQYGSIEVLTKILELEGLLDSVDETGKTPLHFAASAGNTDALSWFIEKGVDLQAEHYLQHPPLWLAIGKQQYSAVNALVTLGANPNQLHPKTQLHPIEYLILKAKPGVASKFTGFQWPSRNRTTARVIIKLIRNDDAELLAAYHSAQPDLFEALQGIPPESIMQYYQSKRSLELYAKIKGDPSLAQLKAPVKSTQIADTLVNGKKQRYPKKLYDSYGPMTFPVTFVLGPNGRCIFPKTPDFVPDEVQRYVERQVSRFSLVESERSKFELLSVLNFEMNLPSKLERTFFDQNGVDLKHVSEKPRPNKMATPMYPYSLRAQGLAGKVVVELIITAKGEVLNPRALSYTHPAFVQPAIEAIKRSSFHPAKLDGENVATRVRLPILFNI